MEGAAAAAKTAAAEANSQDDDDDAVVVVKSCDPETGDAAAADKEHLLSSSSSSFKPPVIVLSGEDEDDEGQWDGGDDDADGDDDEGEPPDGGYGWVIVFSSIMCGWIISTNFTGFSMLYVALTDYYQADKGVTGWIGSCHIATGNFLGLIFSMLIKNRGCRFVTIAGALISCVGFILSFFATGILYLFITFGLIAGVGSGMIFLGSVVIVQQYFTKKRAMAAGIASAGLSMGTLTGSPMVQYLIDTLGWRGALLINAGLYLHVCVFGSLLRPVSQYLVKKNKGKGSPIYKPQVKAVNGAAAAAAVKENGRKDGGAAIKPRGGGRETDSKWRREWRDICDFSALRNPEFLAFCVGNMLCAFGFLTFYQHTPGKARHFGIEIQRVAFLPTITGLVTVTSRITFGFVANLKCVNRIVQFAFATFLGGIVEMLYVFATEFSHFVVFCVVMGLVNGAFFTVTTTVVVDILSIENAAKGQAISSLFMGSGFLLGTPFAGWLFDISGGYELSFYVTGAAQAAGGLIILALPVWRKIKQVTKKSQPKGTYKSGDDKCELHV